MNRQPRHYRDDERPPLECADFHARGNSAADALSRFHGSFGRVADGVAKVPGVDVFVAFGVASEDTCRAKG
jgi:hypothetical protein